MGLINIRIYSPTSCPLMRTINVGRVTCTEATSSWKNVESLKEKVLGVAARRTTLIGKFITHPP